MPKVLLSFAILGLLAGCGQSAEVHYRLTVEVDTPQGVRSGSGVWSFKISKPTLALASPYSPRFHGEAVAVDVSAGRTLFALVEDVEMLPERHFADLGPTGLAQDRVANVQAIARRTGVTRALTCATPPEGAEGYALPQLKYDCPLLVTFRDNRDPRSIERVYPNALQNKFGPGVKPRQITLTITDDPVTTGIEKRLKWLPNIYNMDLGREFQPEGVPVGDLKRIFSKELDR